MRTRAGWVGLALMALASGVAVAPRAAAQGNLDVGRASPVVPLPLYHDRPETGGFYAAMNFVMIQPRIPLGIQQIAVRGFVDVDGTITNDLFGAPTPGAFLGTGTEALNTSQLRQQRTYQPGWQIDLGWRFSDASVLSFKVEHVHSARYTAGADIIPRGFAIDPILADTFLFAPVFNFPVEYAGQAQEMAVGAPGAAYGIWNAAQSMTIEFTQRYDQWDLDYRVPIYQDDVVRSSVIVGLRFAWIWERFKWRTVSADFQGVSDGRFTAIYSNIVSNRMYGPYLGCQHEWYLGRGFFLGVQAEGAALYDIVKERAYYERGDRTTKAKKAVTEYKFTPELAGQVNLTWYPFEGCQVRLGWDAMAFFNTAYAEVPVSFNFGQIDPDWKSKAIRFYDGFRVGIGFTF
jgi:hypothetical protein